MPYSIRNKRKITIHDGWAGPSVTIRCETDEWADRMNELVAELVRSMESAEVWTVNTEKRES